MARPPANLAGASLIKGDPDDRWWDENLPDGVLQPAIPAFEQARRLESEGRLDEAFAMFEHGNRLVRPSVRADEWIAAHGQGVRHLKEIFTPSLFSQRASQNLESAPIFIVGLPRSGSTLVEQILATHPWVQGMGEASAMVRTVAPAFPFDLMGPFDPPAMARDYLRLIREAGWKRKPRFTDKMLANFTSIGHIHLMFPRAVILHTVREPADTCFSCFRRLFLYVQFTRFTYSLTDLGRFYVTYRGMMDHWRATLVGRVIDIKNEDLVADPEGQTRRLLELCGLPWDDRCLRFYENPREVRTASKDQVKEPIFDTSIGRWRRYRKHLGPLFEALGPYAPADA